MPQVSHCKNFTGAALASAFGGSLRELDVSGCKNVGAAGFGSIARLQRLRRLSASCCSNLDDTALVTLASSLTGLEQLDISACAAVTADGLVSSVGALPALRRLDISGCGAEVRRAARGLERVTVLGTAACADA